jgi:hypothetical protein
MAKLTCLDFSLEILFVEKIDSVNNKSVVNKDNERIFDIFVSVKDIHYSGEMTIPYVTESEIKSRVGELCELYQTLKEGKCGFYDWEADINFVEFISDGSGHFEVCGTITKLLGVDNYSWSLKFSKQIDQTYFKNFINELQKQI